MATREQGDLTAERKFQVDNRRLPEKKQFTLHSVLGVTKRRMGFPGPTGFLIAIQNHYYTGCNC